MLWENPDVELFGEGNIFHRTLTSSTISSSFLKIYCRFLIHKCSLARVYVLMLVSVLQNPPSWIVVSWLT